jgi:membrane protease YdiL (CAAX protease family)
MAIELGLGVFYASAWSAALLGWGLWAFVVPQAVLGTLLVVACRRWLDRRSVGSLGFRRPGLTTPLGLLLGLVVSAGPAALLLAAGGFRFTGTSVSRETALLVPLLAVAAFHEELLCRGYLLQNFVDSGRPALGVFLSSLIFWLLHALNPAVWSSPIPSLNLFLAGVVLALAKRASGDLWFPTALHYAWNIGQGVLFQLPISGVRTDGALDLEPTGHLPLWLTGGAFGLESSLLTSGFAGALAAALGYRVWRRPVSPS